MAPSALIVPELKDHFLSDHLPGKPSIPPLAKIPLKQLEFASPNPNYLGYRYSMASLDFLGENHLLFTFRVPGLIRRGPGQHQDYSERKIRALVISLPSGKVQADALWTLHDHNRYLWSLKGRHFLLRNRDTLYVGNAGLQLKPILHFPGPVLTVEMDPAQQFLLTNSREPVNKRGKSRSATTDGGKSRRASRRVPDLVLRLLRRNSGKVLMVSRVRTVVHIAINSKGYVQGLRGPDSQWVVQMNYFKGGTAELGRVKSVCTPTFRFISEKELLATTCKRDGGFRMVAMTIGGQLLWSDTTSAYSVWPLLRTAGNGSRLVRETIAVLHALGAYWALSKHNIKAQRVRVLDAATGDVAFEATVDPVLDGGGNVAISPSGRRVAILKDGAIQVFKLPPPPPFPKLANAADSP